MNRRCEKHGHKLRGAWPESPIMFCTRWGCKAFSVLPFIHPSIAADLIRYGEEDGYEFVGWDQ